MESEQFWIDDRATGKRIAVRFEDLAASDREDLEGLHWNGARFRSVWLAVLDSETLGVAKALKLVAVEGEPNGVLGLVFISGPTGHNFLKNSLVETAPRLRHHPRRAKAIRGIGEVLVARLILESQKRGNEGRLEVNPVGGTREFYRRLGFKRSPRSQSRLVCDEGLAISILARVRRT